MFIIYAAVPVKMQPCII